MFCRHCGKEVVEQAYICPSCGRLTKPVPISAPAYAPTPVVPKGSTKKFEILSKVFSIVTLVFCGAFLLLFGTFLLLEVMGRSGAFADPAGEEYWIVGVTEILCMAYAMIFGIAALPTTVLAFVFGRKVEKGKAARTLSLVAFILGIMASSVAFLFYFGNELIYYL